MDPILFIVTLMGVKASITTRQFSFRFCSALLDQKSATKRADFSPFFFEGRNKGTAVEVVDSPKNGRNSSKVRQKRLIFPPSIAKNSSN